MKENDLMKKVNEINNLTELDEAIIQDLESRYDNGWYNLADKSEFLEMPIDIRYEVRNYVTYKMGVLLLKYYWGGHKEIYCRLIEVLKSGISVSFDGHGYEDADIMLDSLIGLYENGLKDVLKEESSLNTSYTTLINEIRKNYYKSSTYYFVSDVTAKVEKLLSLVDDDVLFVYGTLMKQRYNHHYLKNEQYITDGRLSDYGLLQLSGYPGAVKKAGGRVIGELYRCNIIAMKRIDYLEGSQYKKIRKMIRTESGYYCASFYEYINEDNRKDFIENSKKWGSEQ